MKNIFSVLKKARSSRKAEHLKKSEVFCMAPWVSMHVGPKGHVFPCCIAAHDLNHAIGDVKDSTLKQSWNSAQMKKLRTDMLEGTRNHICKLCYEYDNIGKSSPRSDYNKEFSQHYHIVENQTDRSGAVTTFSPKTIDIRLSNLCNFKCRICSHHFSTSWYQDAKEIGLAKPHYSRLVTPAEDIEDLWDQLQPVLDGLEKVHFAGGEPLIMEEHYRILSYLIDKQKFNVSITYNTNFSVMKYKDHDVIDLWKRFKSVTVCASLDGMGKRGEYMRSGQNWDQTVQNRKRMLEECPHVNFILTPAVGILNVLHIPDFYRNWVDSEYIRPEQLNLYMVFEPDFYNIQNLPDRLKGKVESKYNEFLNDYVSTFDSKTQSLVTEQFKKVLKHLNNPQKNQPNLESYGGFNFKTYNQKLDEMRSESFLETFPELAELYDTDFDTI